jgi:hypothetical protein
VETAATGSISRSTENERLRGVQPSVASSDYPKIALNESGLKSDIAPCPKSAMNRHDGDRPHKRKSRPAAALNSNLMLVDQAAISAGFDFRR